MARKIILDSDPGHDDAVAILLAAGNPNIDLLAVTTVGGNQSLDKVTYNARAVLEKAHRTDIPVYAGCDRPLVRPQEVAASIHGQTGLDGVELPVPTRPLEDMHAVNFIVKTIMENEPGTITLVPTGPLTNIAMAVRMEPRIVERVKEVVLMGGGYHVGNWSTVAYLIDPTVMTTRRCPVDVELTGTLTTGMTVADLRGPEPSAEQCHTQVAVKLDFDKFWDLVTDAIERIG